MLFLCRAASIYAILLLLVCCGACSQKWRFATPGPNGRLAVRPIESPAVAMNNNPSGVSAPPTVSVKPSASVRSLPPTQLAATRRQLPRSNFPSQVGQVGMAGRPPQWQQAPTGPYVASQPQFAPQPGPAPSSGMMPSMPSPAGVNTVVLNHPLGSPCDMGMGGPCRQPTCDRELTCTAHRPFFHPRTWCQDVCCDYRNYYTCHNARSYLYAVAGASLLANTSLDDDFRDWYQRDVRSEGTDNFSAFWKTFGEGEYVVPFFVCTAAAGKMLERFPIADAVGEHGYRTTRAYLVGFPPMLFSQHLLGGSRPNEAPHGSMWRPFEDNNAVSGHAFMGAVPFITAAQMSESKLMKFGFYTLSTFPAWSRVNDDAHFASQVCLGWFMAYMACSSVNDTSNPNRCFEVMPLCEPGGAGVMAIWKR